MNYRINSGELIICGSLKDYGFYSLRDPFFPLRDDEVTMKRRLELDARIRKAWEKVGRPTDAEEVEKIALSCSHT